MEDLKILNKEKRPLNEDIKFLHVQEMNNLVITHSPCIENDNFLSGEMDKYYFDNSAKIEIVESKLIIAEHGTNEGLCFDLSKIEDISPISKNNDLLFTQEYVFAFLYDGKQVITFYFD